MGKPINMWDVLHEYVQQAYDLQAKAQALLIGTRVCLLPCLTDTRGEIAGVKLDAEHGLVFLVHLLSKDGTLEAEGTWQPSKRLAVELAPLEDPGQLDAHELRSVLERRLEQDEDN